MSHAVDTLSNQSPKAALNLCEKFLKKKPDSLHLKAVYAYLLSYVGKFQEAEQLASRIANLKEASIEEIVGTTIGKTFSVLGEYEKAAKILNETFKHNPSVEVGLETFYMNLRSHDLHKSFLTCLKLFGLSGNIQNIYTALCIAWMDYSIQISTDNSWATRDLIEKLFIKVFERSNNTSADDVLQKTSYSDLEFLLNICFCVGNSKYITEILDHILSREEFLEAAVSDKLLIYRHLSKAGRKQACYVALYSLIEEKGLDDWESWALLIECLPENNYSEYFTNSFALLEKISVTTPQRTINLAKISWAISYLQHSPKDDVENVKTILYENLNSYLSGNPKSAFVPIDIRHLFQTASTDLKKEISQYCINQFKSGSDKDQNWLVVAEILGCDDETLGGSYEPDTIQRNLHVANSGANGLSAADQLCRSIIEDSKDGHSYGFHIVGLILSLITGTFICLHDVGDFQRALQLFHGLDIKMVQLDTLLYLVSDHVFVFGEYEVGEKLFDDNFYIYELAQKEVIDGVFNALKKGLYVMASELFKFLKKMDSSIQSLACISGSVWSRLMCVEAGKINEVFMPMESKDTILDDRTISQCSDNRDFSIFTDIDPTGKLAQLYVQHLSSFSVGTYYWRMLNALVLQYLSQGQCGNDVLSCIESIRSKAEPEEAKLAFVNFMESAINLCQNSEESAEYDVVSSNLNQLLVFISLDGAIEKKSTYGRLQHISNMYEIVRLLCLSLYLFQKLPIRGIIKYDSMRVKDHILVLCSSLESMSANCQDAMYSKHLTSFASRLKTCCVKLLQ